MLILVLLGVGSSLLSVRTELLVLIPGNSPSQEVAPPLLLKAQAFCLTAFLSAIWSTSQIDLEINYLSLLASSSMPHDSKGLLSDLQLQFQPPTQAALNSRASGVLWKPQAEHTASPDYANSSGGHRAAEEGRALLSRWCWSHCPQVKPHLWNHPSDLLRPPEPLCTHPTVSDRTQLQCPPWFFWNIPGTNPLLLLVFVPWPSELPADVHVACLWFLLSFFSNITFLWGLLWSPYFKCKLLPIALSPPTPDVLTLALGTSYNPSFPGGQHNPICGQPEGLDSKESACNTGDMDLIPGSGRSPGEGHGYPLQYSCLENPMDRGTWTAVVLEVTKSWTQLSD